MLDIVVSGGLAVLPSGPQPADIGVVGDKIAAIGAPGSLAGLGAGRVVDATGQIVIPGGIDPHVHCRWPMPIPGQTQPNLTDGPDRVSQAALHGGTTTIIDFVLVDSGLTVQYCRSIVGWVERSEAHREGAEGGRWASRCSAHPTC